jgi:hypothetical protein
MLPTWIFPVLDTSGDTLAIIRPLQIRVNGADYTGEIQIFSNTIALHAPNPPLTWESYGNGGLYTQTVTWDINDLELIPAPP